jgi:RNA polymerase sigma-70 factor (ECF subfamily)
MELLERFAKGELEAFETLFRQFQREVYGWIVRIVRNPAAAEDLTVETFWRIYRSHSRFDPDRCFGAWARRVASNAALDYLKTVRPEVELSERDERPERMRHPYPPDPAVQREVRNGIATAFRKLPAKLQVAATLALVEERPYQEIAEALACPVSTVKSRVFRATALLRKKLKRMGIEP